DMGGWRLHQWIGGESLRHGTDLVPSAIRLCHIPGNRRRLLRFSDEESWICDHVRPPAECLWKKNGRSSLFPSSYG
ncbi:hypothetical protein SK128_017455, partial [Halocaridina rubra]